MEKTDIFNEIIEGSKNLLGIELDYIGRRNKVIIRDIDLEKRNIRIEVSDKNKTIPFNKIEELSKFLSKGKPIHVDSVLGAGSSYRSALEAIISHLPKVGYMEGGKGRNEIGKKVIQWFPEDVNQFGKQLDVSDEKFGTISYQKIFRVENNTYLPKPFLLLAGISGTGKTRFVREQAKASNPSCEFKETYELVSVRPDWHEPSDLLGYVSRLGKNGAEYVVTDVLKFMVKAWLEVIDTVDEENWTQKPHVQIRPFWLCLDEMNLAPVEQYFADYLSVLETREWQHNDQGELTYQCDALLKADVIDLLEDYGKSKLQKDLGLEGRDDIWSYFLKNGIAIPFNLIVAGTVNMDETTHGFSRKVIDRANTLDFGEFFPNDISEFFSPTISAKTLSYPLYSNATKTMFKAVEADKDGQKTQQFFESINAVLKQTPFELAFRAFNELCLTVVSFAPKDDKELLAVFDDFLMCKVLPRIEGDEDKLTNSKGNNLLDQLTSVLETQLAGIWMDDADSNSRPDLLRQIITDEEQTIEVPCRSRKKLDWMNQQINAGFTSFWP